MVEDKFVSPDGVYHDKQFAEVFYLETSAVANLSFPRVHATPHMVLESKTDFDNDFSI